MKTMALPMTNLDVLRLKVAMIARGVHFPSDETRARTGGAGPTLGRYFLINDNIVVNAPVRTNKQTAQFHALELHPLANNRFQIKDFEGKDIIVTQSETPKFYQMQLADGTPMTHIALVHGIDCLATTIVQHCGYFDSGFECRYCSIPVSLQQGKTVLRKSPEQFLEVLNQATIEGCASHLTLTLGSPDRPDRGVREYVDFVSTIRKQSDIPIHVQLEPPDSPDSLRELKEAGVDTVGIHLETYSDNLREKYCPGKFQYASYTDYQESWQNAVSLFGRGQVSSFILLGLGETTEQLHKGFEETIKMGVIPVPVPCRPNPGSQMEGHVPDYVNDLDQLVDIYLDCATLLFEHELDPAIHRAGCIRCDGCTALTEAYQVIKTDREGKH